MNVEPSSHQLQIDEQLDMHQKGWLVQRIGWILIFTLVAAAAFGVFGDGLASKISESGANTSISYDRFYRQEARMELKVSISNPAVNPVISFPGDYITRFKLESVVPEPVQNTVSGGMVHYTFNGTGPMNIIFRLIPEKVGTIEGRAVMNGEAFQLSHLIYP